MSVIHSPQKPIIDARLWLFPVAMVALLSVLFFRLWYFQVVRTDDLAARAAASLEMTVPQPAPRGLIFDRYGELVAGVRPEIVVTAIPEIVSKHPDVLPKVAQLLEVDVAKLEKEIEEGNWRRHLPVPIYAGATVEAGSKVAEAAEYLPGIGVSTVPMRYYPDTKSFTHVLGYVWVPNGADVERIRKTGTEPADYVGKQGIERAYESDLMGEAGTERVEVDAKRRPKRVVGRDSATPGRQLSLTLDADLQRFTSRLMEERGFTGGVVALEPSTGEVLAMVSSPTFNQAVFEGGITQKEWDALQNDPRVPMMNRSIQTPLAPGSTFKIVTTIAAARMGQFSPNESFVCRGGYRMGNKTFKCLGVHGAISFHRAMEKSCNSYFSALGHRVGREKLAEVAAELGLGERTEIEIGGEVRGDLPNERWLKRARDPAVWYGGDVVNASLGQGAVAATPLQMAQIAALVANNGTTYKPHFVKTVTEPDGRNRSHPVEPIVSKSIDLPAEFWADLRTSLVSVIQSGTARSAQIPGVIWGGKTGSAEHRKKEKTHGWFVGFAPADDPKIAICVRIEAAGHGGDVAAPVAKEVVKRYLDRLSRRAAAAARASSATSGAGSIANNSSAEASPSR